MSKVKKGVVNVLAGLGKRMAGYVEPYKTFLGHPQKREHLGQMMVGLTSDLERKSTEPIAIRQGLPRRVLQNFVGMTDWDWDPLRQQQRLEITREIGVADGMLIIDGSAVPKKGNETVGVARQWCGRLGKVDNCVVGVHAVYLGRDGQASLVDSQLFLTETWANDQDRRAKTHVPKEVVFATKVQIGQDMVACMSKELPFTYVTADEEYGRSTTFRDKIRTLGKWSVLEIPCNTQVQTLSGVGCKKSRRADALCKLVKRQEPLPLQEILVSYGEKEPICVRAIMIPVFTKRDGTKVRVRETLLYTEDSSGEKKFYLAHVPNEATLAEVVQRARGRHRIEEVFGEAKGEVGMDHFECRAWHGWHHHMTLVQMAHWFLVREQRVLGKKKKR